jgi:LysM repeat protein
MSEITGQIKRLRVPALLVTIALLVGLFSLVPSAFAQTTTYTVKSTDTLGSIALAHRVTVQSLIAANPNVKNPNIVFSGEMLTIPAPNLAPGESIWSGFRSTTTGGTAIPVTGPAGTYIVKPKDTLGSIAFAHRVTVQSLAAANPTIKNFNVIFTGERLSIPAANLAPGESIWQGFSATTGSPTVTAPSPTATSSPAATATAPASTAQPTQAGVPVTGITPTAGMQPTQTAPVMGTQTNQTITVSETEFKLDMPTTVSAGMVTFNVTNNGTVPHSLEIQGQGVDQKLPSVLQPGQSGTLQVNLVAGTYTVFCPVDDHKGAGMVVTLTVQ